MKKRDIVEKINRLLKALDEDDLEGMSVFDPDDDVAGDEADKWLKENEGQSEKQTEASVDEPRQKVYMRDWTAPEDIEDHHREQVEAHMKDGYSEREAHRLAGTHKEHQDMRKAMKSGISPSIISEKMFEQLKPLAKEWLGNADRNEKMSADIEKNPMKHAAGHMMQVHEEHSKDYKAAYHEFLQSDELSKLKGRDRHKAVKEWKENWKNDNPDYHQNFLQNVSPAQQKYSEAKSAAKASLHDRLNHIATGGISTPSEMTTAEGAQHIGSSMSEDSGPSGISHDPSARFASQNPELVKLLAEQQADRKKRIDAVKKMKGAQKPPTQQSPQEPKTETPSQPTVVRRRKQDTE